MKNKLILDITCAPTVVRNLLDACEALWRFAESVFIYSNGTGACGAYWHCTVAVRTSEGFVNRYRFTSPSGLWGHSVDAQALDMCRQLRDLSIKLSASW